jgi:hypothetical protein
MDDKLIDKIKLFWAGLDKNSKAILIAGATILVLYFVMSPYQNCKRDTSRSAAGCIHETTW